jgi:hypothetical protein
MMVLTKQLKIFRSQQKMVLMLHPRVVLTKQLNFLRKKLKMAFIKLPKMVIINSPKSSINRNPIDFFWMTSSIKRLQED